MAVLDDIHGPRDLRGLSDDDMAEAANNVRRGVPMATPVFNGATEADIETMLELAGLDRSAQSTLYDGRTTHARTVLETISDTYGLEVIEPPIPKTIKFAEAPAAGRSILATSRASKGAQAYREVAANLVTRAARGATK